MDGIIESGHVIRGWIGVQPQEITPDLAENFGVKENQGTLIAAVIRDGPAFKAGVKPGDILTEINGKPVADRVDMMNMIAQLPPNKSAKLTFVRKGKPVILDVMIGTRETPKSTPDEEDDDVDSPR
jgi:serine protease DegQ